MGFTGLALLTKVVLPGIPLTRMMPLESIMVEALQVDETINFRRKKKVKKLEMQIIEDTVEPECPEGTIYNPSTQTCDPEPPQNEPQAEGVVVPVQDITDTTGPGMRNLKPKSVQPDEHGQCPDGYRLSTELGNCILNEECPEGSHFDQNEQKCMPDTVPKPETPSTSVGQSPAPRESTPDDAVHDTTAGEDPHERPMPKPGENPPDDSTTKKDVTVPKSASPEVEPASLPEVTSDQPPLQGDSAKPLPGSKDPHDCPDGQHYDYDAASCVPDDPITERVKRFQAEDRADSYKTRLAKMEKRYVQLDTLYQQLLGKIRAEKQARGRMEKQIDRYNIEKVNDEVKIRDMERRVEDLTLARDDYKQQLEKLQRIHNETDRRYRDTLATNLELSTRLRKANEDYLKIAGEKELVETKLGKARNEAKKIVKIKV